MCTWFRHQFACWKILQNRVILYFMSYGNKWQNISPKIFPLVKNTGKICMWISNRMYCKIHTTCKFIYSVEYGVRVQWYKILDIYGECVRVMNDKSWSPVWVACAQLFSKLNAWFLPIKLAWEPICYCDVTNFESVSGDTNDLITNVVVIVPHSMLV